MPTPESDTGVSTVLATATRTLRSAGVGSPRVDAELLLAHVLQVGRGRLLLAPALAPPLLARFDELLTRRAAGVPVQHLTGRAPFRHLDLAVGPGVFIPRPETELLIELAAADLARARTAVDLCAGSGAVALAVADEYPAVRVFAVERSAGALVWLRRNAAERAAAGDPPVTVVDADVRDPGLLAEHAGRFDVVLANPPYVPAVLADGLSREVAHDPADAVYAGADGLALMPGVLRAAARLLRPSGLVVVEHDESQRDAMTALFGADGWTDVAGHRDLAGRERFASARRAALSPA